MKAARVKHQEAQIDLFAARPAREERPRGVVQSALERITLVVGDLSLDDADALVCPANASLAPGDVVEGAIRRAAGRAIDAALLRIRTEEGGCRTGHVVVTDGFQARARQIIHAVAPRFRGGAHDEDALLAQVVREALLVARRRGARTVAFPPLSTGKLAFAHDRAAPIVLASVVDVLTREPGAFDAVRFVLPDELAHAAWSRARDALSS